MKWPQRNSFEMKAHDLEVNWNTPQAKLERAVAKLREQNEKNRKLLKEIEFNRIWR